MKVKDVQKLVDLASNERAAQMLMLGAELESTRKRATKAGALPSPLQRESITEGPAAPLLERLHGIRGAAPERITGLRETGRRLKTKAGDVADLVLTPQARKKLGRIGMERSKDKSVKDLAVRQLALGMLDGNPVSRCCAAYAYWQATGAEDVAVPILNNAVDSDDDEERMVAAHSLAKISPRRVRSLQGTAKDDQPQSPQFAVRPSMTVIIHGTFAKDEPWYQPNGDFHQYIKSEVFSDVYSGSDFFFWSGRYAVSDQGLKTIWRQAARKLVAWCASHPAQTLRLIAHSHGNNVVNMATQMNLRACTLIQLSPPVRSWNLPKMQNVSSDRLFNIHSSVDLVVMIDGGAQDYRGTAVSSSERRKIISRFGHSDSHVPKLWRKQKVPNLVRSVCP